MDSVSELCYKGTILQRSYREMTIKWSFSYYSFVKLKFSFSNDPFVKLKWSFSNYSFVKFMVEKNWEL